jgi:hypothetical protein
MRIFTVVVWTACLSISALAADPAPAPAAEAAPPPPPNPHEITAKMTDVVGSLEKIQTGEPVQKRQKVILSDLDALIASLEKACSACKGNMSRNRPLRPAADSTIRRGTGGIGDLVDPGQSAKDWAKLSPRERDRILQSMTEGFPPEYRTVLERYYRRLAEEKAAPAPGATAKTPKAEEAESVPGAN